MQVCYARYQQCERTQLFLLLIINNCGIDKINMSAWRLGDINGHLGRHINRPDIVCQTFGEHQRKLQENTVPEVCLENEAFVLNTARKLDLDG